ncbi:hypothetical protein ILUMI_19481 [Ignelater luminosus]|uniref:G-protein coupled receptors family 1 profile domain-containing protein n=1 Tax=Ignelater luminosus TaxID=2038154 RepID=A0A8K0G373_IGNLU|nr:hypothetical protein ILUMI_19481 [Ignelater luminosus]
MTKLTHIAYQIIAPTLIILGILGNALNLIVLSRPFLNECTRIYLRALAIADLNVLIFQIPTIIRLNHIQGGSMFFAIYHAHLELVLVTTFIAFSVYIVMGLTIERYISVCVPTMFNTLHTKRNAKIFLVSCFVIAFITSVPLFLLKLVCRTNNECHKWSIEENIEITETIYWYVYLCISETLIRIGPAVVLIILNTLIIRKFRIVSKKRKNFLIPSQQFDFKNSRLVLGGVCLRSKKFQEEKRLIILLQAVMVLFFLTMIPSSCLSLLYSESENLKLSYQIFRAVANLLETANSALNFCAYFLCSKEFRTGLSSIFVRNPVENNRKRASVNESDLKGGDNIQTITIENGNTSS